MSAVMRVLPPFPEPPRRDHMVALYLILLARKQTKNSDLGQAIYAEIADQATVECRAALNKEDLVFPSVQEDVLELLKMCLSEDEH